MTVSPTSSNPGTGSGTPAPADDPMAKLSGNFSTFLTLLTAQLKNQDPTSPMDSNQFTQQLVMYSQVEQQIQSNTNLKTLIQQGSSSAAAMAVDYLGKKVSITNGSASMADGAANWTYNLDGAAARTSLTVTNAAGKIVYTGNGETASGNHLFTWDGKDNNGNALADGAYKLTVTARDANGASIDAAIASAGTVTQIDMTGATPQLIVGYVEIGLGDVAAIAN